MRSLRWPKVGRLWPTGWTRGIGDAWQDAVKRVLPRRRVQVAYGGVLPRALPRRDLVVTHDDGEEWSVGMRCPCGSVDALRDLLRLDFHAARIGGLHLLADDRRSRHRGQGRGDGLQRGALGGLGAIFKKMLDAAFLAREVLPTARLQRLHSERVAIIAGRPPSDHGSFETRRALVTNALRFAEETLNGWIKGSHFELCVFVDPEQPLLFAYFASNRDSVARSMTERERNPKFYIDKGYEVTKLLEAPTSHPRVIGDTHDAKAKYVLTSAAQQKQLRSTLLLCLDLGYPCALVVSSNEAGAIPETDPQFHVVRALRRRDGPIRPLR